MQLRRAVESDSEAIRLIYNTEVLTSTATLDLVPRSPRDQVVWMSGHSGVYPVLVADAGGVVAGFSSLSAYRPRPGTRPRSRTPSTSPRATEARAWGSCC